MSAARTSARLLRLYPAAWRRRYGSELECLIVEAGDGGRVPWRTRLDVALAGGRERLRAAGLGPEGSPGERVRGSALAVLCAWALFAVGGILLQRFSEHWQSATPPAARGLPTAAFAVLVAAAGCGAALVLAGSAAALPSFVRFLRGGGWPAIRRRVRDAALLTPPAVLAIVGLAAWASGLGPPQREGGDAAYAAAWVLTGLLCCAALAAWTAAAVAVGRRLRLPAAVLRLQGWLCAGVAAAMATATAATAAWWVALAGSERSYLTGSLHGVARSSVPQQLLLATAIMALATALALAAAWRALRELPSLSGEASG